MRFPDEYIERERLNEEASQKMREQEKADPDNFEYLKAYQEVIRESHRIYNTLTPTQWGLEHGDMIFVIGDTGIEREMYRIFFNTIQFHDRKDYWFPEHELTAYDLVFMIRRGRAMLLKDAKPSFDNYADGL